MFIYITIEKAVSIKTNELLSCSVLAAHLSIENAHKFSRAAEELAEVRHDENIKYLYKVEQTQILDYLVRNVR